MSALWISEFTLHLWHFFIYQTVWSIAVFGTKCYLVGIYSKIYGSPFLVCSARTHISCSLWTELLFMILTFFGSIVDEKCVKEPTFI